MHRFCLFRKSRNSFQDLSHTQHLDAVWVKAWRGAAVITGTLKKEQVLNFHCLPVSTSTGKQTNPIIFGKSNACWWSKSYSNDSSVISSKPHLHFEPVEPAIKSRGDEQDWEDEPFFTIRRISGCVMTEQTDDDCREAGMSWWDNERDNR